VNYKTYDTIFKVQYQMELIREGYGPAIKMEVIFITTDTAQQAISIVNQVALNRGMDDRTLKGEPEILSINKLPSPLIAVEGMERSSK